MLRTKVLNYSIFVLFSFIFSYAALGQSKDTECNILHEGTFKYGNVYDEIKVVIEGNIHTEYHNNGQYLIKSKLVWVSDCEFNMTMTKITIPNFPFGKGDVMNVKVNRVKGNEIFYTSTVKGESWDGKMIKQD